ncbi:efflux transporter periplasmic adaptor subunit [Alteromonas sp. MB-3u-76]|uniref:efflux RND transporter periplasmic adaptor subunit n=1 Tax=Alteromonas sp. MB-3u-76 TaxID=2058133 RepID=UPI000C30A929|nr:efflux RND transporter periplasmic adaptor subunit [Alteromonas sp. MB-3u-76]AUC87808.1 efflux transporter periplasmic adaptor subunit [Alteromonas sp. MB-3u-76]
MNKSVVRTMKTWTRLLALFLFVPLAHGQFMGDRQAKLVVTKPIEFMNETRNVEAVGSAEAVQSIILYSAVADKVTEVNFVPGQAVEKGKVLVRLDDRRQKTALKRAELTLSDAQRTVERLEASYKQGAVPVNELDLAKTQRDLAEVALEDAKTDLEDRYIVAPFDGVVGFTDVEVGDRINEQTMITTLDNRSKLFVNFKAPEAALPVLLNSPDVTLEPWSDRETLVNAEIAQVDSRINEADRTLRARALLDNRSDQFRPGMSFRVNLTIEGDRYAAIPESALLWGATGAYIWLAVDGKAQKLDVSVHQRLRGTILVSGDITVGDTLISEGVQRLRTGQSITTEIAGGPRGE